MHSHKLVPKPLKAGDCIGIIAPAGQIAETDRLEQGIAILKEMGFEVKIPRQLLPGTGYLADTDSNRALEFHKMWADDDVSALLALRGGFGCLRMLPFLDLEELRKQQKMLIGFSDLTILHTMLHQNLDLLSLHGPMLTTLSSCTRESLERFHACLTGNWNKTIHSRSIEVLRGGGPVTGRLVGGNLSSLISILSTPFHPDFAETILFLEDVGEPLYRLDRMFSQLSQSGILQAPAAILLGDFSPSKEMDRLESIRFHEEIWTRVLELTEAVSIPVWGDFPVGHGANNLTLAHGSMATADSYSASLSFS
jgi:muramoyltetrapeptide carboxypeptidase